MEYTYKYPRPAVTVDIIIIKTPCEDPEMLLIQRLNPPYKDQWALPGGFVDMDETCEEAAHRELMEETGLDNIILQQFKTYSGVNRDPRGRTISIVYSGIARNDVTPKAGDDAKSTRWFKFSNLPDLAFDHDKIISEFRENH
mgnify:FL=1